VLRDIKITLNTLNRTLPRMPYRIIERKDLNDENVMIKVEAPEVAVSCKAGQFIIIRANETAERIPLTISDWNKEEGWVKVIFQKVGASTYELAEYKEGDYIMDFVGPLGKPTEVENAGSTVVIGGGLGIAIATPVARAFKEAGNPVDVIIGARRADLLFLEDELKKIADNLYICTDDGSKGRKGFVTEQLEDLITNGKRYDTCFTVGPPIMMKFVAKITKKYNIKTIASINSIMVDGTGMCGACRVTVGGETKFACVDGPDFDAHQVDWENLMQRLTAYKEEERIAMEYFKEKHQ